MKPWEKSQLNNWVSPPESIHLRQDQFVSISKDLLATLTHLFIGLYANSLFSSGCMLFVLEKNGYFLERLNITDKSHLTSSQILTTIIKLYINFWGQPQRESFLFQSYAEKPTSEFTDDISWRATSYNCSSSSHSPRHYSILAKIQ